MIDIGFVGPILVLIICFGFIVLVHWLSPRPDKHKGYEGPLPPRHFNCLSSLYKEPDYVEYQAVTDSRTDIKRENIYRRTSRIRGKVKARLPGGWFKIRPMFARDSIEMSVLWICYQKTGDDLKVGDVVEILRYEDFKRKLYFLTGRLADRPLDNPFPV